MQRGLPLLEHFEIHTLQFLRGHLWEQISLAAFARGAYLVNANYSAPLAKRNQLITLHDASVRAHPKTFSRSYRLINNLMVSVLAPRVDTVMTVSRFSANELRRHYKLTRDDWVVGREGWEHVRAALGLDEAEVLQRHGLVSGRFLLAVGSLKAHKNLGLIARALRMLDPRQTLPVVVAGSLDSRVYKGVEPPDDAAMRWLGFVPDDELQLLYRHAAWFIFPSVYEGFGLPPLEALAHGCPVLAARAGPTPEIYGDAVLYFDAHDPSSLAALLRDVTERRDAASAARRHGGGGQRVLGPSTLGRQRRDPARSADRRRCCCRRRRVDRHDAALCIGGTACAFMRSLVLHVTFEHPARDRTAVGRSARRFSRWPPASWSTPACIRRWCTGPRATWLRWPGNSIRRCDWCRSPAHCMPDRWRHLNAWRATLCSELSSRPYDAVHLHAAKAGLLGRAIFERRGRPSAGVLLAAWSAQPAARPPARRNDVGSEGAGGSDQHLSTGRLWSG